jgi:hypothetical protein
LFDIVSKEELQALAAVESPVCVSFYLPTHASDPGMAKDPIRLKNLVAEARLQLEGSGIRTPVVAELLAPVVATVDETEFWAHVDAGLAVFVNSDGMRRFRLAGAVDEAMLVSDRFWIAPLVPFVSTGEGFYVLALSENAVRLFRASRYHITELTLGAIPASMGEALEFDDRESQLQSHGADRVGAGEVSATFHGQGVGQDFGEVDRARFLQSVDRGLTDRLGDSSDPLVVAGVSEMVAQFRNLSGYRHIADPFVGGNPEHLTPQEVHERAVSVLGSQLDANQADLQQLFGSPATPTVDSLQDTVDAAMSGRVAKLFMVAGRHTWGTFDAESGQVDEHEDRRPGDHDLNDLAMRETLGHGGEVFVVDGSEMPTRGPLAAVLRY